MQKQKHGFWLFVFSLIPGAGEMYMGFKKQGLSIMLFFWGIFALGSCTGMDWLIFLIPVIWFYSFFNVHNLKTLSEEEFYSIEDTYLLHMDELLGDINILISRHRTIVAVLLIVFGASILWNNLVDFLIMVLPSYLADALGTFAYHLPQLVIAVAIILAGLYILTRKKDSLDNIQEDDLFDKKEHYWTPYRPYQQNTSDTVPTVTEPDISQDDISTPVSPSHPDSPISTDSDSNVNKES